MTTFPELFAPKRPGRWKIFLRIALTLLLVIVLLCWYGGCAMMGMPGKSFSGPLPPLSADGQALRDALREHVRVLSVDIGERNVQHYDKLLASELHIQRTLTEMGYTVGVQSYVADGKQVKNFDVEVPGQSLRDQIVIVGAHYDAVGTSPAANDNGTGIAATFELARRLKNFNPDRTLRFVFFVNEEPPFFQTALMGSLVYARRCKQRNENIVAMFSLETIGYFDDTPGSQNYPWPLGTFYPDRGNFIAFVGGFASRALVKSAIASFRTHAKFPSEGGAMPESLPGIGWSDHWSFAQVGYPAIMITDTAPFRYPHYHTPGDTIDKIDFDKMTRVVLGFEEVVKDFGNRR